MKNSVNYKHLHQDFIRIAKTKVADYSDSNMYRQAIKSSDSDLWKQVIESKIELLYKNNTWQLVIPPLYVKILQDR